MFRPLLPMLAEPAEDLASALGQLGGDAVLEYKVDGARIQVHKSDHTVRVYSRSGQDVSAAVPEVVELVVALPAASVVLDGEVIALRSDGRPLPFQETMRRFGRKRYKATYDHLAGPSHLFHDYFRDSGLFCRCRPGRKTHSF